MIVFILKNDVEKLSLTNKEFKFNNNLDLLNLSFNNQEMIKHTWEKIVPGKKIIICDDDISDYESDTAKPSEISDDNIDKRPELKIFNCKITKNNKIIRKNKNIQKKCFHYYDSSSDDEL
jgi:hypothetical protein